MRVVFQMSSNDSASLIESPQANDLGLHRAILSNGQEGWTENLPAMRPARDCVDCQRGTGAFSVACVNLSRAICVQRRLR